TVEPSGTSPRESEQVVAHPRRPAQAAQREQDNPHPSGNEEHAADRAAEELEREVIDPARERLGTVGRGQEIGDPEAEDGDSKPEEQQPNQQALAHTFYRRGPSG